VITLRYHVISIAAVFLSIAVGVVLGSTALGGTLLSSLSGERDELAKQVSDLHAERNSLTGQLADADGFAGAIGPLAVRGQLDQRTVVLVSTADASAADRDALRNLIGAAGGTITGELTLTESFTDPNKAGQLSDVVTRLLPAGVQLPTATDPGTLAGGLIGPLLLINKDTNQPQASPEETSAALAGLADGGFVRPSDGLSPGQLAIVLTGGSTIGTAGGGARTDIQTLRSTGDRAATIARFAVAMDRAGAGVVLAGGAGSAKGVGSVGVVRADGAAMSILSTVDNADTGAGRVVTVLALRGQLEGRAEHYGTAGNAKAIAPGGGPAK
jgi:hypothetical protein